ncbi:MAG TPA: Maf family protein [Povalibacter sp.]|uniref:Maf family protein n=1 Tax=Povalibacter sp. TaxID=1962978 RepID=UPI002C271979|nr:Maf family protein [Povalibacter sp.]HMN45437.1 Maf family protein [Povalibacter sp.]
MTSSSNSLIWLASASPRRSALLTQIGVAHRVRPVDIDESLKPGELPVDYVRRLAIAKAEALWERLSAAERAPVLGSDTTVALGDDVLGKPRDRDDALRILRRLSARTHQVYTAVAVRHAGGCDCRVSISDVSVRALREEEIAAYWESGEPVDKAGAYGIQGRAAVFIERIAGSYSGIVGLPLFETGELLRMTGWTLDRTESRIGVSA